MHFSNNDIPLIPRPLAESGLVKESEGPAHADFECGRTPGKWVWVEASEAMEPYFREQNGCPLPNECVAFVLGKPEEKIEWLDDGFHYRRIVGQDIFIAGLKHFGHEALAKRALAEQAKSEATKEADP